MEDIRRRKGEMKGENKEREMNHERLWTLGNKLWVSERRWVGRWVSAVMGIKEDTFCNEHWVLYANNLRTLHQKLMKYCMVTNII